MHNSANSKVKTYSHLEYPTSGGDAKPLIGWSKDEHIKTLDTKITDEATEKLKKRFVNSFKLNKNISKIITAHL